MWSNLTITLFSVAEPWKIPHDKTIYKRTTRLTTVASFTLFLQTRLEASPAKVRAYCSLYFSTCLRKHRLFHFNTYVTNYTCNSCLVGWHLLLVNFQKFLEGPNYLLIIVFSHMTGMETRWAKHPQNCIKGLSIKQGKPCFGISYKGIMSRENYELFQMDQNLTAGK